MLSALQQKHALWVCRPKFGLQCLFRVQAFVMVMLKIHAGFTTSAMLDSSVFGNKSFGKLQQ
jgi:hypothetical protein